MISARELLATNEQLAKAYGHVSDADSERDALRVLAEQTNEICSNDTGDISPIVQAAVSSTVWMGHPAAGTRSFGTLPHLLSAVAKRESRLTNIQQRLRESGVPILALRSGVQQDPSGPDSPRHAFLTSDGNGLAFERQASDAGTRMVATMGTRGIHARSALLPDGISPDGQVRACVSQLVLAEESGVHQAIDELFGSEAHPHPDVAVWPAVQEYFIGTMRIDRSFQVATNRDPQMRGGETMRAVLGSVVAANYFPAYTRPQS
jgi:hypothetical protein